jgi:hypothetical protein
MWSLTSRPPAAQVRAFFTAVLLLCACVSTPDRFQPDVSSDGSLTELSETSEVNLVDGLSDESDLAAAVDTNELDTPGIGDGSGAEVSCEPQCADRECGWNGCGAKCGVCNGGTVCIQGYCLEPSGDFGSTSFVNEVTLGASNCCFDLDEDGLADNGLEAILTNIIPLLQNTTPDEAAKEFVEEGSAPILIQFDKVDDWEDDLDVVVHFIVGADADDDFSDNLSKDILGVFLANPEYLDESGQPRMTLKSAVITGGLVRAQTEKLEAYVPIDDSLGVQLVMEQVVAEVNVSLDGQGGVVMSGGKLGGLIRDSVIHGALNAYIESTCSCLGLSQGLLVDGECATDGNNENCNGVDEDTCGVVYGSCELALTLLQFDVDTDGDGFKDAVSVGIEFAGIPALIAGVAQ